jgi:hypothetical protein
MNPVRTRPTTTSPAPAGPSILRITHRTPGRDPAGLGRPLCEERQARQVRRQRSGRRLRLHDAGGIGQRENIEVLRVRVRHARERTRQGLLAVRTQRLERAHGLDDPLDDREVPLHVIREQLAVCGQS